MFTQDITTQQYDIAITPSGRLRSLWLRLRSTVQEMNYATRRALELQAPWIR